MPLATRRLPLKAFAFIMISTFLLSEGALVADAWKEQKGDHFIVYYQNDENFAKQVTRHSEMYYTQIANELGYARHSNFWQWENRVKIYIHPTAEEFRRVTGEKEWSVGMASYFKKEIHTFSNSEGFMDGILPHEITHLIFRDFVGTQGAIPMWVDEGVAQYMEPQKRKLAKSYAQYLIKIDKEFPLYDLMRTNVRKYTDPEKVNAFYMQSVSLIDYLISRYGAQSFTQFCRELRDGKGFDDSLRAAYPNYIESVPDLEQKWRKYVALNQEEGAAKVLTAK